MSKTERMIIIIVFMIVFCFTSLAAIFHGKGPFPEIPSDTVKWIWGTLLGEIVIAVIFAFKMLFRTRNIDVYLEFHGAKAIKIDFDDDKCEYKVIKGNKIKDHGRIIPDWLVSGWRCTLPESANDCDKVKLILVEKNGQKWEVPHFRPTDVVQKAFKV